MAFFLFKMITAGMKLVSLLMVYLSVVFFVQGWNSIQVRFANSIRFNSNFDSDSFGYSSVLKSQ